MTTFFWQSTQRARKYYFCDWCCQDIEKGQLYDREAVSTGKSGVMILYRHNTPTCPEDNLDLEHDRQVAEREALGEPVFIVAKQVQVQKMLINGDTVTESETVFESTVGEAEPPLYASDDDPDIPF